MDKYKTNSAFNKWFSHIQLEKLPASIREKIDAFDNYQKKLLFANTLRLFLYAVNEEKESFCSTGHRSAAKGDQPGKYQLFPAFPGVARTGF